MHALVLTEESGQLLPPGQPPALGGVGDLVGRSQRLLRSREELPHLVGEPAQTQQRAVRGPQVGVLGRQQILHRGELLGGGQDLWRFVIVVAGEPFLDDAVGQAVDRDHVEAGQRGRESLQERLPGRSTGAGRADDEGNAFGIGAALDEGGEAFTQHRGLAGAGRPRHQQRAAGVVQHVGLPRIGGEQGRHTGDATRRPGHGSPAGI